MAHMLTSENNFWKSVLFYHVDSRNQTRVLRLGRLQFYMNLHKRRLFSQVTVSCLLFLLFDLLENFIASLRCSQVIFYRRLVLEHCFDYFFKFFKFGLLSDMCLKYNNEWYKMHLVSTIAIESSVKEWRADGG